MTHELASGDFLALEVADLCDPGVCPVNAFREFCGPSDPCMARALRPHTLRAEFGINKVPYQPHSLHVSAMIGQLTLMMSMYLSIACQCLYAGHRELLFCNLSLGLWSVVQISRRFPRELSYPSLLKRPGREFAH
jgi:hypothetical protein